MTYSKRKNTETKLELIEIFDILYNHFGPQGWWPGESELEIAIGAVLTQNTSWKNVERAINSLKSKNLLDVDRILCLSEEELAELIRPAGYYRLKAKRLRNFLLWLKQEGGFDNLKEKDVSEIRNRLLEVKGIGRETADSIILYALNKPIFVVDAYTKRILKRMGIIEDENKDYDEVRMLFEENLPRDVKLYNEFHALFVRLGKEKCLKRKPICEECPLSQKCKKLI